MIIYGAGAAGIETVALILKEKNIIDICFFDEDKTKQNINIGIHNFPVLHSHKELQDFIQQSNDNRYLITIGHPRLKEKMEKKSANFRLYHLCIYQKMHGFSTPHSLTMDLSYNRILLYHFKAPSENLLHCISTVRWDIKQKLVIIQT